jgi:hypothetical protein
MRWLFGAKRRVLDLALEALDFFGCGKAAQMMNPTLAYSAFQYLEQKTKPTSSSRFRFCNSLLFLAQGHPFHKRRSSPVRNILFLFVSIVALMAGAAVPPEFTVQLDTISSGFDKKSCWVHPRAGVIPGPTPIVILTLNKAAIQGSDIFGPINDMRSDNFGKTWSKPVEHAATLGHRAEAAGVMVSVCDFWPKWHVKSGKLLGIGHSVRYQNNKVMPAANRTRETVFSVYDPDEGTWAPWKTLPMPDEPRFFNSGAGSVQRLDLPDGDILLPIYFSSKGESRYRVAVMRCGFDGEKLAVKSIGNELAVEIERGLVEPSLTKFGSLYYMTMRNDQRAYVSTSSDGQHFSEPKAWTWDDGTDLGSYNTQAHWVTHDDALFLVYTRRGANNDHIPRNRAPLFIGRVDTETLAVIRDSESELMPQRGAKLGNFGVTEVNEHETWVTDAEWMQTTGPNYADYAQCMKHGSDNAVFASRIQWLKPNTSWNKH